MKGISRRTWLILIIVAVSIAVTVATFWLAARTVAPAKQTVRTETLPAATPAPSPDGTAPVAVAPFQGQFRSLNGQSTSGSITAIATADGTLIRLSDDFSVSWGPDLLIAVGRDGQVGTILEPLESRSGAQEYLVPADIAVDKGTDVFIHCRAFNYPFGAATLH